MINLGSVFVGENESFWGVYDFNEGTMMVTLVELKDKQLDDWCMRQVFCGKIQEVHLNRFGSNEFFLVEEAYFNYNLV